MIRTLTIAAGLAVTASSASAALTGFEVREDAAVNAAARAVAGVGTDARVLRMFAIFDGAGDVAGAGDGSNSLVGVTNTAVGATTFSLASGSFFQQTLVGTNFAPNPAFFGGFPDLEFDSFLSIGSMSNDTKTAVVAADFNWTSTSLTGSWFITPDPQGNAVADGAAFSVFVGQFTITGAGAGGSAVEVASATQGATTTGFSELLRGSIMLGTALGGSTPAIINFVPTPGALALFGFAGIAAARRRRNA